MFCSIYKSNEKAMTYLYVVNKDNFEKVPKDLLRVFGPPQFMMVVDLEKREKLAVASIDVVKRSLTEQGYYLQLPPALDTELQHIRDKNTKL